MMKINNCTVCGSEDIFLSVKENGAFICGGCGARFSAVPEQITVTEDGTAENDFRLGLLFMADGKTKAAAEYLKAAAETGIELAGRALALLEGGETEEAAPEEAVCENKAAPGEERKNSPDDYLQFSRKIKETFHRGLGLLKKDKDTDAAYAAIEEAARAGYFKAAFRMGIFCENQEQYGEAVLWYRQAAGREFAANEKLAALLIRFGREAEAEKLLIESAEAFRASSFIALGDLYAYQGRTELAGEYYELCSGIIGYEKTAERRLAALDDERQAG